jgi:uncharacterized protein YjbI with pentapeptide repeats
VDCDFSGAVFDDAEIHRTMFKDCTMTSTSWRNTEIGVGDSAFAVTQMLGCDLTGADFTKSKAHNLRLVNSTADKTSFALAELSNVHLDRTVLTNTDFEGTDIHSVSVIDSTMDATVPEEMTVSATEIEAESAKRAEANRRARYAGGENLWPQEEVSATVNEAEGKAPEL